MAFEVNWFWSVLFISAGIRTRTIAPMHRDEFWILEKNILKMQKGGGGGHSGLNRDFYCLLQFYKKDSQKIMQFDLVWLILQPIYLLRYYIVALMFIFLD